MIQALFDTNIILDIALKRLPFFEYSSQLFEKIDQKKIEGFVTASTVTDIYYISRKEKSHKETLGFLLSLLEVVDVVSVDRDIIVAALHSNMHDFEDAVQTFSAKTNEISFIVTRNVDHFKNSGLKVFTPEKMIQYLSENK